MYTHICCIMYTPCHLLTFTYIITSCSASPTCYYVSTSHESQRSTQLAARVVKWANSQCATRHGHQTSSTAGPCSSRGQPMHDVARTSSSTSGLPTRDFHIRRSQLNAAFAATCVSQVITIIVASRGAFARGSRDHASRFRQRLQLSLCDCVCIPLFDTEAGLR